MSNFCETCPMRGNCSGEVANALRMPAEYEVRAMLGKGPIVETYTGVVASLVGENGGVSVPFAAPPNENVLERAKARLDNCTTPYTETVGLFRKRTVSTGCRALGGFALNPMMAAQFQNIFQSQHNLYRF